MQAHACACARSRRQRQPESQGSCQFGNLDGNSGTGHDIAALSDADPEFSGSCGRCYEGGLFEVSLCLPMSFALRLVV